MDVISIREHFVLFTMATEIIYDASGKKEKKKINALGYFLFKWKLVQKVRDSKSLNDWKKKWAQSIGHMQLLKTTKIESSWKVTLLKFEALGCNYNLQLTT